MKIKIIRVNEDCFCKKGSACYKYYCKFIGKIFETNCNDNFHNSKLETIYNLKIPTYLKKVGNTFWNQNEVEVIKRKKIWEFV